MKAAPISCAYNRGSQITYGHVRTLCTSVFADAIGMVTRTTENQLRALFSWSILLLCLGPLANKLTEAVSMMEAEYISLSAASRKSKVPDLLNEPSIEQGTIPNQFLVRPFNRFIVPRFPTTASIEMLSIFSGIRWRYKMERHINHDVIYSVG